jgi:hypothetical protein
MSAKPHSDDAVSKDGALQRYFDLLAGPHKKESGSPFCHRFPKELKTFRFLNVIA